MQAALGLDLVNLFDPSSRLKTHIIHHNPKTLDVENRRVLEDSALLSKGTCLHSLACIHPSLFLSSVPVTTVDGADVRINNALFLILSYLSHSLQQISSCFHVLLKRDPCALIRVAYVSMGVEFFTGA